jgi:hypothetical protein
MKPGTKVKWKSKYFRDYLWQQYGTLYGIVNEVIPHDPDNPKDNHGTITWTPDGSTEKEHASHYGWENFFEIVK